MHVSFPNVHVDDCDVPQLVVEHQEVRLYMDCGEADRTTFHRGPDRLTFSHNSGLFVANAGGAGLDNFVVGEEIPVPASKLPTFMVLETNPNAAKLSPQSIRDQHC